MTDKFPSVYWGYGSLCCLNPIHSNVGHMWPTLLFLTVLGRNIYDKVMKLIDFSQNHVGELLQKTACEYLS